MAGLFLVCGIGGDNCVFANPFDMSQSVRQVLLSIIDELSECFDEDVASVT